MIKLEDLTEEQIKNYISELTGYSFKYDIDEINEEFENNHEYYATQFILENDARVTFYSHEKNYNISNEEIYEALQKLNESALIHCHPDTKNNQNKNVVEIWYSDEDHVAL